MNSTGVVAVSAKMIACLAFLFIRGCLKLLSNKKVRNPKKVMSLIQWTWGLPQTILGALVVFVVLPKATRTSIFRGIRVLTVDAPIGVSLGAFIILTEDASAESLVHEYGHCIQSAILGPLYLILVGLPSALRVGISFLRYKVLKHNPGSIVKWYYGGYPEKWADKLGGVAR